MKLLYDTDTIQSRIAELAQEITTAYQGRSPIMVGVLKGCTIFMSHLLVKLSCDVTIDYMTLSSYDGGTQSGELKIVMDLLRDVGGRDVLICEDIVDTGRTLAFMQRKFRRARAASVKTVTLLNKPRAYKCDFTPPDFIGFEYNGPDFIIGFGLDFEERLRNLPALYTVPPDWRAPEPVPLLDTV